VLCGINYYYSVSPSGNFLFYGDIFGKIVALEIASFKPTTEAPTEAPTKGPAVETEPDEEEESVPPPSEAEEDTTKDTSYPTWSPVAVVPAPSPVALPKPEPNIDAVPSDDDDTNLIEMDDDEVQYPTIITNPGDSSEQTESELAAAAAGGEGETKSFFSNQIMVILVAVCGGLALAIVAILLVQRARTMKKTNRKPTDHVPMQPEEDGEDWSEAQDEYEEACRRDEEETLREIVGMAAKTPGKSKRSKKQKKMSPKTPSTLASIEECPGENELSFVSDATPKNLEKSFDISFMEGASKEVTFTQAQAQKDNENHQDANNISRESDTPPELTGVEVVSKSAVTTPKEATRYTMASPGPAPELADCSIDVMSVDGSLYLDDDSYLQGSKFDVASLSQYSMASTTEGNSELGSYYPGDEGSIRYEAANPGDQYMKPPRVASPLLQRNLSPEVTDYLRRNESTMPPNLMTPRTAYVDPNPTTTSPMTPPSGGSGADVDRDAVRAGQSVRPGGSDRLGRKDSKNRSRTPSPPRPPVDAEDDAEPEDAWSSFLSELARAEREFFSPSFKKKNAVPEERPSSPPPPPPPSYPPPDSAQGAAPPPPPPPDPPAGKHRKMLM
jgi:hypothetical protein